MENATTIYEYEMFTKSGNKACHSLVTKICKKIQGNKRLSKEEVLKMVVDGINKIAIKHGEVNDTEPEANICYQVNKELMRVGYGYEISRWDF